MAVWTVNDPRPHEVDGKLVEFKTQSGGSHHLDFSFLEGQNGSPTIPEA